MRSEEVTTTNVTQINESQAERPQVQRIYQSIEVAKTELDGANAVVIQFQNPETDELTDEEFADLWEAAVLRSMELFHRSSGSLEVSLLLTNLIDDLLIWEAEASEVLFAVQR